MIKALIKPLVPPPVRRLIRKVIPNRPPSRPISPLPDIRIFSLRARYYLQVNRIDGAYLEFGSHEANTFRMALNTLGTYNRPNKITHFYAFDSFEGMPEPEGLDKQKIWRAGMNSTGEARFRELTLLDAHRVTTVKGFYNDSLSHFSLPPDRYPALAYLDCDYYSSTKEVLTFLSGYLRHGVILAFDDWDCYFADPQRGQRLAFSEFAESHSQFHLEPWRVIPSGGMAFIVLERAKIGTDFQG
jgi:O-methyltransferase